MGCGLRKEIIAMMSLLPDAAAYKLEYHKFAIHGFISYYTLERRHGQLWVRIVCGGGRTKAEALEALLENWRSGNTSIAVPAPAGSREELELMLAIRGNRECGSGTRS